MRYTVLIALLLAAPLFAAVPQQVPFIATHGQQPREWYLEQAQLWRAETKKDPANANAWRNYYMATEYGQRGGTTDKSARAAILAKMQVHVADSYEYAYLQQRHYDGDDLDTKRDLMEEAYARCNSCGEIIENLAYHSEITGQHERARGLWAKLYQTRRIAPGLFDYNYNMLQSTLPDAILFTNGDNDTFPALTLQQSQEIRPDVLVLNLYTIQRQRDLLARALAARDIAIKTVDLPKTDAAFVAALAQRLTAAAPDVPLYFALSVSAAYKEQINDRLYIEGLASRYSAVGVDNLARLQYNLEHRFRIDYLTHAWYGQFHPTTEVNRLNTNYAFPFILLAEHYQQSGEDTRAHRWRERALDIARPYPYLIKELENRAIK